MAQYINKDALVAEIKRQLAFYLKEIEDNKEDPWAMDIAKRDILQEVLSFIDTLEVKEVDDELQGIEKEVAEGFVERINKKRISISLKGEKKAKFKNEFNTLWQVVDGIQFANVAKHIIERLCLHFAAWGAYNLKEIGQIDKDDKKKMDVEVKEVDLEKEIDKWWWGRTWQTYGMMLNSCNIRDFAKHFFELGMAVNSKLIK